MWWATSRRSLARTLPASDPRPFPLARRRPRFRAGFGRCFGSERDPASCLYERLGVPASASLKELRIAYFRKARRVHPDINPSPDAAAEFRVLAEAYEVLSDPRSRAEYDVDPSARPAAEDPRWKNYADPERSRRRWRELMRDHAILREAWEAERQDLQQDLGDLAESLRGGDLKGLQRFAAERPGLLLGAAGPFAAAVLLTRYPPLALWALRLLPHLRFWGLVSSVVGVPFVAGFCQVVLRVDLSERTWRAAVRAAERARDRARARRQRKTAPRVEAGDGAGEAGEEGGPGKTS